MHILTIFVLLLCLHTAVTKRRAKAFEKYKDRFSEADWDSLIEPVLNQLVKEYKTAVKVAEQGSTLPESPSTTYSTQTPPIRKVSAETSPVHNGPKIKITNYKKIEKEVKEAPKVATSSNKIRTTTSTKSPETRKQLRHKSEQQIHGKRLKKTYDFARMSTTDRPGDSRSTSGSTSEQISSEAVKASPKFTGIKKVTSVPRELYTATATQKQVVSSSLSSEDSEYSTEAEEPQFVQAAPILHESAVDVASEVGNEEEDGDVNENIQPYQKPTRLSELSTESGSELLESIVGESLEESLVARFSNNTSQSQSSESTSAPVERSSKGSSPDLGISSSEVDALIGAAILKEVTTTPKSSLPTNDDENKYPGVEYPLSREAIQELSRESPKPQSLSSEKVANLNAVLGAIKMGFGVTGSKQSTEVHNNRGNLHSVMERKVAEMLAGRIMERISNLEDTVAEDGQGDGNTSAEDYDSRETTDTEVAVENARKWALGVVPETETETTAPSTVLPDYEDELTTPASTVIDYAEENVNREEMKEDPLRIDIISTMPQHLGKTTGLSEAVAIQPHPLLISPAFEEEYREVSDLAFQPKKHSSEESVFRKRQDGSLVTENGEMVLPHEIPLSEVSLDPELFQRGILAPQTQE